MINEDTLDTLADIFSNTERPDKIIVECDPVSMDVTITYHNLDTEWFKELVASIEG